MSLTEKEREKLDGISDTVIRIDERTKGLPEWKEGVEGKVEEIRISVAQCQAACAAGAENSGLLSVLVGKLDAKTIAKILLGLGSIIVLGSAGGDGLRELLKLIFGL